MVLKMQRLKVGAAFIGWPAIIKLYETASDQMLKLLVLCYFKTGGRSSEVLCLTKEHFDFKTSKYSILVKDMIVLKKYKMDKDKNGKVIIGSAVSLPTFRTFPILKDELLSDELTTLLDKEHKGLLFHYPYKRNWPLTRQLSWHRVTRIGERAGIQVSDHWFRGQRTAQMKLEYLMRGEPLDEWFGWTKESGRMQQRYGALGWQALELEMLRGRKDRKEAYDDV